MAHTNHRTGKTNRRDHHRGHIFLKDCLKDEADRLRRVQDNALCSEVLRGGVDPEDALFSPSVCGNWFHWD